MNATAQAAPATPSAQQQRVLAHLAAAFGTVASEVEVLALDPPRDLPEGAAEFYVEARGSHGHDSRNCVLMAERVYCSGAEDEFARLLREQALLRRPALGAAQVMRLFSLLALPRGLKYADASVLARDAQAWRAYPDAAPPALARQADGGATLVFYATPALELQPSKWTVRMARDGQVEVEVARVGVGRR